MSEDASPKSESGPVGPYAYFKLFVELLRVVLWPAIVVLLFFNLRAPLKDLASRFPDMASRATTVSISGTVITLSPDWASDVPDKLRTGMGTLSPDAIEHLVELGVDEYRLRLNEAKTSSHYHVLKQLEGGGFITLREEPDGSAIYVTYSTTENGREAIAFLRALATREFLRALRAA